MEVEWTLGYALSEAQFSGEPKILEEAQELLGTMLHEDGERAAADVADVVVPLSAASHTFSHNETSSLRMFFQRLVENIRAFLLKLKGLISSASK